MCGGFLAAPDVVITAARCLDPMTGGHPRPVVHAGRMCPSSCPENRPDRYESAAAESVVLHPKWKGNFVQGADLALVFLGRDLAGPTLRVSPSDNASLLHDYEMLTFASWSLNYTGHDRVPGLLREVELPFKSKITCSRNLAITGFNMGFDEDKLCAGGYPFPDVEVCQGDSGGPLIIKGETWQEDVAIGVLSAGSPGCGKGTDDPAIFTSLFYYRADLARIMSEQVRHRFPYLLSLHHPDNPSQPPLCGGFLAAPMVAITAAHCVDSRTGGYPWPLVQSIHACSDCPSGTISSTVPVSQKIIHNKWTGSIADGSDLAVLFLDRALDSPTLRLHLPNSTEFLNPDDVHEGSRLMFIGQGISDYQYFEANRVAYVNSSECSKAYGQLPFEETSLQDKVCARWLFKASKAACKGNSGGPLIRKGKSWIDDVAMGIWSTRSTPCDDKGHDATDSVLELFSSIYRNREGLEIITPPQENIGRSSCMFLCHLAVFLAVLLSPEIMGI